VTTFAPAFPRANGALSHFGNNYLEGSAELGQALRPKASLACFSRCAVVSLLEQEAGEL